MSNPTLTVVRKFPKIQVLQTDGLCKMGAKSKENVRAALAYLGRKECVQSKSLLLSARTPSKQHMGLTFHVPSNTLRARPLTLLGNGNESPAADACESCCQPRPVCSTAGFPCLRTETTWCPAALLKNL